MKHPYWARREIAQLDPQRDARRIAHLSMEVRYGSPLFVHTLFSLAFARQVAVPAIAKVLYRDGQGLIMHNTAKRNDDTLVFFGLLFRHIDDPQGRAVVDRLTSIHSRFNIPNDLNLYTLASLACLPSRIAHQFLGRDIFTPTEAAAAYHLWCRIGGMMGIHDIPDTKESMLKWMLDFEANEYGRTEGGARVTRALAREFATRWAPTWARGFAERMYYATFDEHLTTTHGLPPPSTLDKALITTFIRGYALSCRVLPDPGERDLIDMFGQQYQGRPQAQDVGPQS